MDSFRSSRSRHWHPGSGDTPDDLVLEMMQTARAGSPELDAQVDSVLTDRVFVRMVGERRYHWRAPDAGFECREAEPGACWSQDLMASLQLIPGDHNFSIGQRDGVCWAWIQPNDNWAPGSNEFRHDHPQGSGLVVAYTIPLALVSAAVILCASLAAREPAPEMSRAAV